MRNELPKEDEAPHALPNERIDFNGAIGEERYASTERGFEVAVVRKSLHRYCIAVIKPRAVLSHMVSIRTNIGGVDTIMTSRKPKDEVVVLETELLRYSDRVLISISEGDAHDMFVFMRDPTNVKTLIMVTYVGVDPNESQQHFSDFFEQGKA